MVLGHLMCDMRFYRGKIVSSPLQAFCLKACCLRVQKRSSRHLITTERIVTEPQYPVDYSGTISRLQNKYV